MEKLIKAGHLRRYVRELDQGGELGRVADKVMTGVATQSEPRPTINYIMGGSSDDQHQSKCLRKKFLRAATVKARVCEGPTRHLVSGKGVRKLRTINLLTYLILNNYLENININT